MELTRFRIKNYKKIIDSDWIYCDNLTVFVGKNEAGKSSILRALSKLNPSDGEKYNALIEYPRRLYTNDLSLKNERVITAEFNLSSKEIDDLKKLDISFSKISMITCSRDYLGNLFIKFEQQPPLKDSSLSSFIKLVSEAKSHVQKLVAPEGKGEKLKPIKNNLLQSLNQITNNANRQRKSQVIDANEVEEVIDLFTVQINEPWQKELLEPLTQKFFKFKDNINYNIRINGAVEYIQKNLPKFVYFDSYDIIEGSVNLQDYMYQLKREESRDIRAINCLFRSCGLNIEELNGLDPNRFDSSDASSNVKKRSISLNTASKRLTDQFENWWDQSKCKFRLGIDGQHFNIFISDDKDSSEIELSEKSYGFKYFFSLYNIFLSEGSGDDEKTILLLDEPGLHMHGTAQGKLIKFLEDLSKNTQILYTTHSPFMIDGDHFERVRVVYGKKDGTSCITDDVWLGDRKALFPLQIALGYDYSQTLFYSRKQVVVEGLTDYNIFKTINNMLIKNNMPGLQSDITLTPVHGTSGMDPLISILIGNKIEVSVILDSDKSGKDAGDKIQKKLFGNAKRIVYIGDYADDNKFAEMEDLLPNDAYLNAVKIFYKLDSDIEFDADDLKSKNINDRIAKVFRKVKLPKFEKQGPLNILIDSIYDGSVELHPDCLKRFSDLFVAVNNVFNEEQQNTNKINTPSKIDKVASNS